MQENGKLTVLNMQDILPNRFQPRIRFDEEKLEELALSISKYGVIQPIVVRPVGNKFEIIAGERRFKASRLANRSTIPAIVINLSDKDSEEIALLENVQRQQLNPIEEAVSYKRILDMGYINQEQLAKKIGKSQSSIVNKIRLLNLEDEVQSYLLNNKISERHARSLLRISNKEQQISMLHRIVEERLTVKQTDREVAKLKDFNSDSLKKTAIEISQSENKITNENKSNVVQSNSIKNEKNETDEIENLFDDSEKDERGNHMDIEKIMKEAKDINVSRPVEKKDISNLMVPESGIQGESTLEVETVPDVENKKFISVQPQEKVQEKPSFSSQVGGVTFDSVFNQGLNIPTNTSTNSSANINLQVNSSNMFDANANSDVKQNNIFDVNTNSTLNLNKLGNVSISNNVPQNGVSNVKKDVEPNVEISNELKNKISNAVAIALKKHNESSVKTITNVPSAVNQNDSMSPSSILSPSNPSDFMGSNVNVPNVAPVSPLNQTNSMISNINTSNVDIPKSVNQSSNVNFEVNNLNASIPSQINQEKFVNSGVNISNTGISSSNEQVVSTPPIINNMNVGSMDSGNQITSNYYNVPDTDIINDVPFNDYVNSDGVSPTMASPMSQSVKPVNSHSNFASIVKMLRDCADKIEANGYFVNVDELDLGNQYKVTFTINKE